MTLANYVHPSECGLKSGFVFHANFIGTTQIELCIYWLAIWFVSLVIFQGMGTQVLTGQMRQDMCNCAYWRTAENHFHILYDIPNSEAAASLRGKIPIVMLPPPSVQLREEK